MGGNEKITDAEIRAFLTRWFKMAAEKRPLAEVARERGGEARIDLERHDAQPALQEGFRQSPAARTDLHDGLTRARAEGIENLLDRSRVGKEVLTPAWASAAAA